MSDPKDRTPTTANSDEGEPMDPPDSAWVGSLTSELHRAMWQMRADGPAAFRQRFEKRVGLPIHANDDDIKRVYALVTFAARVLVFGLPGDSETLGRVMSMVIMGGGKEVRRKAALGWIERAIASWTAGNRANAVEVLHLILPSTDEKFANLDAAKVRVELGRCDTRTAPRIAAALAVSVGAFGDDDEENSRKAFLSASKVSV